jgi:ABC-type xylose transport system permease subunit
MTLRDRWCEKTPNFWIKVRNIAITAGSIGAILLATPVELPHFITTLAGYLVTAGTIGATLSQLTVEK